MKRNFRLFCTMCLAGTLAFFASSCKKSEEKQTIRVILPEFEEAAPIPGEEDRAYINFNDGKFYWNANDQVMLYNIDNTGATTTKGIYATDASAEGQLLTGFAYNSGDQAGEKKDHYFVFYPVCRIGTNMDGSACLGELGKQNREYFNVPAVQYYTLDGNNNPTVDHNSMALATEIHRLNQDLQLQHIFGVCRLRLKGTATVSKIEIIDNYNTLSGTLWMKLHKVQMEKFNSLIEDYTYANVIDPAPLDNSFITAWAEYESELGYGAAAAADDANGLKVTLDCGAGVTLDASTYKPFYFSLRPGALINGFLIKVYKVGSETPIVIESYMDPASKGHQDLYTIKPGKITSFKVSSISIN